jgi:hypothetical protein
VRINRPAWSSLEKPRRVHRRNKLTDSAVNKLKYAEENAGDVFLSAQSQHAFHRAQAGFREDPNASSQEDSNECGIICTGLGIDGQANDP